MPEPVLYDLHTDTLISELTSRGYVVMAKQIAEAHADQVAALEEQRMALEIRVAELEPNG